MAYPTTNASCGCSKEPDGRWLDQIVDGKINTAIADSRASIISYLATSDLSTNVVASHGTGRTLGDALSDHGYDATSDIIRARTRPGYAGDDVALNAAFAANQAVYITNRVGALDIRATLNITIPNSRFAVLGGLQAVPFIRNPTCTGPTMRVGSLGAGAAAVNLENIFFLHAGRGPGQYVEGTALANRLTNGESHLEVNGAQSAILRSIGGWGCVYGITLNGCVATNIENPFFFGGVWDPALPAAQETIAHIHLASGSSLGYNKIITITSPTLIGNMSTGRRAVTVSEKTVQVTRRIGPKYCLAIRSAEDFYVIGGFLGGGAVDTVAISPDTATSFVLNGRFIGTDIDESNNNLVSVYRGANAPMVDGLDLIGCRMNGQICSINGVRIEPAAAGGNSLRRFTMPGSTIRAVLGAGVVAFGLEAAEIANVQVSGYNCANSGDSLQGGIVFGAFSAYVDVDQVRFGGGINETVQAGGADAFGVAANGTQYGLVNLGSANITKGRLLKLPFGQVGGTLSAGTFASDPT